MNDVESAYQKTLDFLYSFVDYSLQKTFRYSPEKFNLERMRAFSAALGNPHQQYPVLHVAGTKGKGSVSAMCASALRSAGYHVGIYTSPHLQDYTERIQVDGVPISHEGLTALVDEIRPVIASIPELTTFEITTALAFLYFARQGVNAGVIEVGLGGRLDSTNIVIPRVAVITSLSYDHTHILGNTLAEIAGEKAGIIKPGIPVVLAPQKDEARQTVERIAAERGSPLVQVGRDVRFEPLAHSLEGQSLLVWPAGAQAPLELSIPLLGEHQVENAATAFATLQTACQAGFAVSDEAIRQGFASVYWPGRFEVLRRDPPVVIDSAHNRDSALKLRKTLDDYFPSFPVIMVFGASEDKDIPGMLTELLPRVNSVIVTRSFHPRAANPDQLVQTITEMGRPAKSIPELEDAVIAALQEGGTESLVLVTGSIFVAAGARDVWQNLK
ncbi:MAG: bifunctional folylpolyglutamate synthase/dihydrofolate synthase [Chloroflexota bacterium]|nr:MAG: bifunctional folylpolyglutamate synthase/dihydrofolate synthase [Chloroflexota bacterium]